MTYSTYVGGTGQDYGWGIGLYNQQIDIFGSTASATGFPVVNAAQPTFGGSTDVFLASISFDTLAITPTSAALKSGDTLQFSASGSVNGAYSYVLLTNETGGTINGAGLYTAGPKSGRDIVFVSDTFGPRRDRDGHRHQHGDGAHARPGLCGRGAARPHAVHRRGRTAAVFVFGRGRRGRNDRRQWLLHGWQRRPCGRHDHGDGPE